jgi:hypothetical protein
MRQKYWMTQKQYDKLITACRFVPYLIIGSIKPRSPQENANAAWASLGTELGFDYMSVKPSGSDNKCFTAEELTIND